MNMNLIAGLGLLLAAALPAAAAKLGDEAPPLKIAEWIKGEPIDLAKARGTQVVVIDFWATWCVPCQTSIPHLTKLQKKFKDQVAFIGVSDEPAAKAKPFVEKLGQQMDYAVGVDDQRKTSVAYLEAFGVAGIPHTIIVDKAGKLAWHGHPLDGMETVLTELLAGKYNLAKAQMREEGRKKLEEFARLAAKDERPDRQEQLAQEIRALEMDIGSLSPGQKFDPIAVRKMIRFNSAFQGYRDAISTNGPASQLTALEKVLVTNAPPNFDLEEFKRNISQSKLFGEYFRAATGRGDNSKLPELARQLGTVKTTNYELLNEWAWTLLTHEAIKHRDLELATQLARAAVTACNGKEPAVLDTYARALFDSGKVADAIAQQKKALALATNSPAREVLEQTLKQYESRAATK